MAYIKYTDSKAIVEAIITPISDSVVRIKSNAKPRVTGFKAYLDKNAKFPIDNGEYEHYTTVYRQGDGWYELSSDGSVYEEPVVEEKVLTSEELAEIERQQEISDIRNQIASLKAQIALTDYQVIKTYEYFLVGKESEYDIEALHAERQALRDQINELEAQLAELTTE